MNGPAFHRASAGHFRPLVGAVLVASVWLATAAGPAASGSPGPYMIEDSNPTGSTGPFLLTAVGDTLFFNGGDERGRELWKSNGTPGGTKRIKDILPGAASSDPTQLTNVDGTLFFSARGPGGRELWKSDGTAQGTVRVRDIRPGPDPSNPVDLIALGSRLVFLASSTGEGASGRALWVSDGTEEGTAFVKDVAGHYPGDPTFQLSTFGFEDADVYGGRLFFTVVACTETFCHGKGLWISDGTPDGTHEFYGGDGLWLTEIEAASPSRLFFTDGTTLWRVNNFIAPVRTMGDVRPRMLTRVGDALYFKGPGGLWKSIGVRNTTRLVKAMAPPRSISGAGDLAFVTARDATTVSLWRSDGTEAGTMPVLVRDRPAAFAELMDVAGVLYFTLDGRLWTSDGTELGTNEVDPLGPATVYGLTELGGRLYFAADDGIHGYELWAYVP